MRSPISTAISRVSMAVTNWRPTASMARSWPRSLSTALSMSGYCSFTARSRPSWAVARCTWPSDAAAVGLRSKLLNRLSQSGPSSAAIRRRTNDGAIGGALVCSSASSWANSGGSRSGTVANICATFISGPFNCPRVSFSARALRASTSPPPNRALEPKVTAAPDSPAPTRANRLRRPDSRSRSGSMAMLDQTNASNSSTNRTSRSQPADQKALSRGSRPNGFSAST